MAANKSKSSIADFEKRFVELEKIVNRMESGDQSLDASISDFEKGMTLCESLRNALNEAEQKVQILVKRGEQQHLEDFDPTDNN
jgi:exodeoxyribonuclease VII small subunit